MLVRFTQDYHEILNRAYKKIGDLVSFTAHKTRFTGQDDSLDDINAITVAILGITDHLLHEDNSDPGFTEQLLYNLETFVSCDVACVKLNEEVLEDSGIKRVDINSLYVSRKKHTGIETNINETLRPDITL